jgi:hypothetical protein
LIVKAIVMGVRVPKFSVFPARGRRIEREVLPKVHHGHDRPAVGFQNIAAPVPKTPNDQAGGGSKHNAPKHGVSSSPSCPAPVCRISDG